MSKTLRRILAMVLVICALMSYTVPATFAATTAEGETYNFALLGDYNDVPAYGDNKTGPFAYILTGNVGESKVQDSIPTRYANGDLNWTYEAASAGVCCSTTEDEHLPAYSGVRMLGYGLRSVLEQDEWIAFRIKSPGAGVYTMDLNFCRTDGDPTVAVYVMEAEGAASIDHDTVMARQEAIHAAIDPENRVGKANLNAPETTGSGKTAFIGNYTFEAGKEYIVVVENYKSAAVANHYTYLTSLSLTPGATDGTELKGEPEVGSLLVEKNLVPAADGGAMGALWEMDNGHDYFFLPIEGGKMAIYDLDEWKLVTTVTSGLYYPTSATVTSDGKVVVGGDGKKLFIFDTKTMTGRMTPDFRAVATLSGEGHNSGVQAGSDGYLYFGTLYGGHMVQYDMEKRTYRDLGDMVCKEIQQMVNPEITDDQVEDKGGVETVVYHDGYAYGWAASVSYDVIVKYDLEQDQVVGAIDVTAQLNSVSNLSGMSILGDKYLIAGGSGNSGLALIDLESFTLVTYAQATASGLIDASSTAENLWEKGMSGHATEVIDGKQYFESSSVGMICYDTATGKLTRVGGGGYGFRTGAKTLVTLDRDGDGVEEPYLFSYGGNPLNPRLFNFQKFSKMNANGLIQTSYEGAGGSDINIGDSYDDVLYIGAWNNWNCVAYDTGAEAIKSRYVTGGQTDSQVSYVDEDGTFHLVSGNYSACIVYEIDPLNKTGYNDDTDTNILMPLISKMKSYQQKRIHTVAGGGGYVFAGTIPTSYVTGGGVGVYNRATGTEDFIRFKETSVKGEKVVPNSELWDLSVQGLEYYDGRLFGTTTRSGGSGSTAVDGTSARIFVMDYENMTIEATLDLRDYLTLVDADKDGTEDPISYVGGISVDEQGRFWGLCSDVLFCFTYDKATKTFTVQEVLNLSHSEYQSSGTTTWKSRKVVFDSENGQLFTSFYKNGMQQVVLKNWNASVGEIEVSSNTQILTGSPYTYALGANNNLYYASGASLYMKPVNVTDSDWAAAAEVDAQIDALGMITADSADAVAAAKAAYNSLSLRDKALVQETRELVEAEAQVLDLQIREAIKNVTADSTAALSELILQYNELDESQKRYVQSYSDLEAAYDESLVLADNALAYAVVDQIAALSDPATLADEEAVNAAREAYEALDFDLQEKVTNLSKLEAAEANIAALKQEAADVQAQINALEVTSTEDAAVVSAARSAYDALSDEQKALVDETALVEAEAVLAEYVSAAQVQEKIDALPDSVTLDNEATVNAVRAEYDALSDTAKAAVDTTKLVSAETQIADIKAAQAVQAQIDALPETVTLDDESAVKAARKAYDALSDAVKADVDTARLEAAEAQLAELLKLEGELQVYDFKLFENEAYMTYIKNKLIAKGAAEDVTVPGHNLYKITVDDISYSNPYSWFNSAFSSDVNWAPEGSDGSVPTNFGKDYTVKDGTGLMLTFVKPADSDKQNFGAVRINVPSAGSFKLDLSLFEGSNSSRLATGDVLDVYIIPAYEDYKPSTDNYEQIKKYLTDNTYYAGSLTYTTQANETDTTVYTINEAFALDAGEHIVVIRENAIGTCRYVYLDSLTLIENVTEEEAVASVGGRYFRALDNALEYQTQSGAATVSLVANAEAGAVSLPENAVLDLNGKTLKADAFDAVAPGAQIIDATGGNGVLVVEKGEDLFNVTNAQLPVYDETEGGYRFFKVAVESVTVTGKNSAAVKYWFKIDIENFGTLYSMIKAGSELNIAAKLTWEGGEAEAVAGADFLQKWAEKYNATNGGFYITVSAVNAEGLESFSLIPCLAANGVEICGDEL